jgi:outer membrane protein TolC
MDQRRKSIAAVLYITLVGVGACAQTIAPAQNSGAGGSPVSREYSFQNQTLGSVPTGAVSPQPLALSLADAIERGLRQNLGLLLSSDAQLYAQGQLTQARSPLLPEVSGRVSENAQKVNLAAEGFSKIASQFPGFPLVVGPFGYFDARLAFSQSLLDLKLLAT